MKNRTFATMVLTILVLSYLLDQTIEQTIDKIIPYIFGLIMAQLSGRLYHMISLGHEYTDVCGGWTKYIKIGNGPWTYSGSQLIYANLGAEQFSIRCIFYLVTCAITSYVFQRQDILIGLILGYIIFEIIFRDYFEDLPMIREEAERNKKKEKDYWLCQYKSRNSLKGLKRLIKKSKKYKE